MGKRDWDQCPDVDLFFALLVLLLVVIWLLLFLFVLGSGVRLMNAVNVVAKAFHLEPVTVMEMSHVRLFLMTLLDSGSFFQRQVIQMLLVRVRLLSIGIVMEKTTMKNMNLKQSV